MENKLNVLIVISYNSGRISPFVKEQVASLEKKGLEIDYFKIKGKGIIGYLKNLPPLLRKVRNKEYDLVHAHYGLSGLLSIMQPYVPVVVTYHGSDVHGTFNRLLSKITTYFAKYNILTNKDQIIQLNLKSKYSVIPCGIDTNLFVPLDKHKCRKKMGFNKTERLALFSSSFSRKVKNYPLAKDAINQLKDVRLIELKGYTREEVSLLINAVDVVLITSTKETGPLIVKEALACNTPVVSTKVGDLEEIIGNLQGCYLINDNANEIATSIEKVLSNRGKNYHFRSIVQKFDLKNVAEAVSMTYKKLLIES